MSVICLHFTFNSTGFTWTVLVICQSFSLNLLHFTFIYNCFHLHTSPATCIFTYITRASYVHILRTSCSQHACHMCASSVHNVCTHACIMHARLSSFHSNHSVGLAAAYLFSLSFKLFQQIDFNTFTFTSLISPN